jgi:hypothetical protein
VPDGPATGRSMGVDLRDASAPDQDECRVSRLDEAGEGRFEQADPVSSLSRSPVTDRA